MIRNGIVSPHFEQRGLWILAKNICASPLLRLARHFCDVSRAKRTNETALGKSCVRKMTDVGKWRMVRSDYENVSVENEICAMFVTRRN
jgi:hypothetical protein